jgi:hypothetical protein
MLDAAVLLGVPTIQNALNAFPQIAGDQRLVLSLIQTAVPLELTRVEPIAQRGVNRAHRHQRPADNE